MNKEEKEILMNYLYPTEVERKIMVDEINEDLKKFCLQNFVFVTKIEVQKTEKKIIENTIF